MKTEPIEIKIARMDIHFSGGDIANKSNLMPGPLILPEGVSVEGELICIGEDDAYLHCIISGSGAYYGVFKSHEANHLYGRLIELNQII